MLGLTCDIQAFYLDRACWLYGTQLDSQVKQATQNAKNDVARKTAAQQVMSKALNQGGAKEAGASKPKFRDPAIM